MANQQIQIECGKTTESAQGNAKAHIGISAQIPKLGQKMYIAMVEKKSENRRTVFFEIEEITRIEWLTTSIAIIGTKLGYYFVKVKIPEVMENVFWGITHDVPRVGEGIEYDTVTLNDDSTVHFRMCKTEEITHINEIMGIYICQTDNATYILG